MPSVEAESTAISSDVVNEYGLQPVVAAPGDREHGEAAQEPGDVVDEDVLAAEDDGGADDGVGQAGLAYVVLDEGLAAEVGQGRFGRWVGDADVDYATDAGGYRGIDEAEGVADGGVVVDVASGESDPVGVVEGVGAFQALRRADRLSSKSSGLRSTRSPKGLADAGLRVRVRTRWPDSRRRWAM